MSVANAPDDRTGSYVWTIPGPSAVPSALRRLHLPRRVVWLAALAVAWLVSFAGPVLIARLVSLCFARP